MKSIIVVLAVTFLLSPVFSQDTIVTIPDANFLAALIEQGVDTNEDGQISYEEAESISNLDISGNNISDMTGIESFLNITKLTCYDNAFSSLDVSSNIELQSLFLDIPNYGYAQESCGCENGMLTELDISNNSNLEYLYCGNNQLTSLDISNNINLIGLYCGRYGSSPCHDTLKGNNLSSLDVSNNSLLRELSCSHNQISELDVSNLNNLSGLHCDYNNLESLNLSNNTELVSLTCGNNNITKLDISDTNILPFFCDSWGCVDYGIFIDQMPSLNQVCCNSTQYEWLGAIADTTGSPNVYFTTECTIGYLEESLGDLSIYPNPTNSVLTIETDQPDLHSIEIISLSGQLIKRTEMEGASKQIDMTPFSKGIYFITVRSDAWVRTEKVVRY